MLKIEDGFMSRLRKYELAELVWSVEEVVDRYDSEALGIYGMVQRVKAEKSGLERLTEGSDRWPTHHDNWDELNVRLRKLLTAINGTVLLAEKTNIEAQQQFLVKVIPLITQWTKNHQKFNRTELMEKSRAFLEATKSEEMQVALGALHVTVYIDELQTLQSELEALAVERRKWVAGRTKSKTSEIKAGLLQVIRNLFRAIELASIEHPERNYEALTAELNNTFSIIRSRLKNRETRLKNSHKKETAALTPTSVATA